MSDTAPRAAPKGLTVVLGAMAALGAAAIDMCLPGLPAIQADLATTPERAALTLGAFFAGMGVGQLLCGPAADAWGRRPVALGGVLVYCAASLACVFAADAGQLTAARFVQAFGAASGFVVARAVVRDLFEMDEAARAHSLVALAFSITPLLAPTVGGWLLVWFGWRAIFLALCLMGAACLLAQALRVPETLPAARRTPISPRGLARGYARILANRRTMGCILAGAFPFAGMFVYFHASPFVFIELHGVPARHYGLLFALNVLALIAASYANARLAPVRGALAMLRAGCALAAAGGVALFATTALDIGGLAGVVLPLVVAIGALGFVGANATAGALAPFPNLAATTGALQGFAMMMLGAGMGWLAGFLHDGTARPMGAIIAALAVLGLVVCLALVRDGPRESGG